MWIEGNKKIKKKEGKKENLRREDHTHLGYVTWPLDIVAMLLGRSTSQWWIFMLIGRAPVENLRHKCRFIRPFVPLLLILMYSFGTGPSDSALICPARVVSAEPVRSAERGKENWRSIRCTYNMSRDNYVKVQTEDEATAFEKEREREKQIHSVGYWSERVSSWIPRENASFPEQWA